MLLVASSGDEVVGYAVLWCIADEGELANIAIRDDYRGRGLGARLLEHVLKTAEAKGVRSLYLEVRPSNKPALKLYRAMGFREIGVRSRYYDRPPEDALVLCLKIGQGIGAV